MVTPLPKILLELTQNVGTNCIYVLFLFFFLTVFTASAFIRGGETEYFVAIFFFIKIF